MSWTHRDLARPPAQRRSPEPRVSPMGCRLLAIAVSLAVLSAGCGRSLTESPFTRAATDVASSFSAAATLLEAAHHRGSTNSYVRGALVNLGESLDGVPSELQTLEGHPDGATIERLLGAYAAARTAVDAPCLGEPCDWRAQVTALRAASDAFAAASER